MWWRCSKDNNTTNKQRRNKKKKILAAALVLCLLCPIFLFSANAFNENDYIMNFTPQSVPEGVYYVGTIYGDTEVDAFLYDLTLELVFTFFGSLTGVQAVSFLADSFDIVETLVDWLELLEGEEQLSGKYFQESYVPEDRGEMVYVQEWCRRVFFVEDPNGGKPIAIGEVCWWVPIILPRYEGPTMELY